MSTFEFRLKKFDETRNYILKEINHNVFMSEKYKKTCKYLNYVEHLLVLGSAVTGFSFNSYNCSLVCVPGGITSSAVGMKICAITVGIK